MTTKQFNEFRFEGLNSKEASNKYLTMDRVSSDETKIVVNVSDDHLMKTKFGYALILDNTHVTFIKDWQVNQNYFGNEVLLNKQYFAAKEWGTHEEFDVNTDNYDWNRWVEIAKEQKDNQVRWGK